MSKLSTNDLALIRTGLANERTYLAYVRSGFVGIGLGIELNMLSAMLIGVGFVVAGMYQYYQVKSMLRRAEANGGVKGNGRPKGVLRDNIIVEVIVFGSLAVLYWAFRKR